MITPMKKVTVLTVASAVEETLQALRTLEILHLTPLQAAAGAKLNKARGEMNRVQKALEVVPEKAPKGVTPVEPRAESLGSGARKSPEGCDSREGSRSGRKPYR